MVVSVGAALQGTGEVPIKDQAQKGRSPTPLPIPYRRGVRRAGIGLATQSHRMAGQTSKRERQLARNHGTTPGKGVVGWCRAVREKNEKKNKTHIHTHTEQENYNINMMMYLFLLITITSKGRCRRLGGFSFASSRRRLSVVLFENRPRRVSPPPAS